MTDEQITALASVAVVEAYNDIRRSAGSKAAVSLMREVIKSAASVASGQLGVAPADFLRDVVEELDDRVDPVVRERADA